MKRLYMVFMCAFIVMINTFLVYGNNLAYKSENDYDEAVRWCVEEGIISGDGTGELDEYASITRAEFAVMICKFAGYEYNGEKAVYSDVAGNEWFYEYIAMLNDKNIMTGSNGMFSPKGNITREEAVTALVRMLDIGEYENCTDELGDGGNVSQWAKGYVGGALKAGIADVDENNTFRPKDAITKRELALMLSSSRGIQAAKNNPLLAADDDGSVWSPVY